jgi:hypothetical protein
MERYTVTELAFGDRYSRSKKTRNEPICILADVRGESAGAWRVYSWTTKKLVNLPKSLIEMHTKGARRWHAISVPRWLVNKEGLWSAPVCPPPRSEDCTDMRTMEMMRDEGDIEIARYLVADKNKYTPLPGQRMSVGGGDLDGGRTRRS